MQINSKQLKLITIGLLLGLSGSSVASSEEQTTMTDVTPKSATNLLRVATFNVSMEANNYAKARQAESTKVNEPAAALVAALQSGNHPQIKNIAEIIQRVQPDVILLNEFDYISDPDLGINLFQKDYLAVAQNGQTPIEYPFVYYTPVNTGVETGLASQKEPKPRLTHYGFGKYPGQYGMVLLSKFPIDVNKSRTFQTFLWKDMPNNLMPVEANGTSWYRANEVEIMRLSSKSHWDVPVNVCGTTLHVLASHPTPPVFDGKEDRNGRRNHDELRFWKDYIDAKPDSYHYDDKGNQGGIHQDSSNQTDAKFVIVGDLNASSVEGDAYPGAMEQLLSHPKVNNYPAPESAGGLENKSKTRNNSEYAATHTAGWGMRADYVLPSANLEVAQSGVYWPRSDSQEAHLVSGRAASSDHRLVWADLVFRTDVSCE